MTDPIDAVEAPSPLLKFSLYTAVQAHSLERVGKEITGLTQDWSEQIEDFSRVYDLFWLWILGAYEVIRTMDQHKDCFSPRVREGISSQKRFLAHIRMPFSKQEMRGSGNPLYSELSVIDFDGNGMNFDISGVRYQSSLVIEDYLNFLRSISDEDIRGQIPIRKSE